MLKYVCFPPLGLFYFLVYAITQVPIFWTFGYAYNSCSVLIDGWPAD